MNSNLITKNERAVMRPGNTVFSPVVPDCFPDFGVNLVALSDVINATCHFPLTYCVCKYAFKYTITTGSLATLLNLLNHQQVADAAFKKLSQRDQRGLIKARDLVLAVVR